MPLQTMRFLIPIGAALALLLALSSPLPAQTTEPSGEGSPEATAGEPEAPQAMAAVEIAQRAEKTIARISELGAAARPEPAIADIAEKLTPFVERLRVEMTDESATEPERLTLRRLEDRLQSWQGFQSQLGDWQTTLTRRAQFLESENSEIADIKAVWTATRDGVAESELPAELVTQIESVLERADTVDVAIDARLEAVLGYQGVVSNELVRVGDVISRVQVAMVEARKSIFALNRDPLWTEIAAGGVGRDALFGQINQAVEESRTSVRRFYISYETRIGVHVGLTVALGFFIFGLRRWSRAWGESDGPVEAPIKILQRPFSAALLVAMIASTWIYPLAPQIVKELIVLSMAFPLVRLVAPLLPPRLYLAVLAVSVLFCLEHVSRIAADGSVMDRIWLLGTSVLALAGLTVLTRPGGAARSVEGSRWWRAALALSHVGYATLGFSILANLVGAQGLAELLTSGTLGTTYVALVLWAGALVVRGVLRGIVRSTLAQRLPSVSKHGDVVRARGATVVNLAALGVWIWATLALFRIREPVYAAVDVILNRSWSLGTISISLGSILAFFLAVWIAALLSRLIRFILDEDVLPQVGLPRGVPGTISMLVHYGLLTIGLVVGLSAAGIEWGQFALVAGALGVGIGFGLQNLVNNFVSGLILAFERPIQIGDTVELQGLRGEVRRIGIRASVVRTFDGAEVIIPNGDLVSSQVINWTLSDRLRRIDIPVGVAYGSNPEAVMTALNEAANKHQSSLSFPEPITLFEGFGDSSLDFKLRFWTANFDNWIRVASEVTLAVHGELERAGIEIPFPQRDLHLKSVDETAREALAARGESLPDDAQVKLSLTSDDDDREQEAG